MFVVVAALAAVSAAAACGGSDERLRIEGTEIEGPVAIYQTLDPVEQPEGGYEARVFAIDLATGRRWDIMETRERVIVLLAADRLVVWSAESLAIHSLSLDGQSEVLLQSGHARPPWVSFDGSKMAFAVDGTPSGDADSFIVLDVQSGDDVLLIEGDDPRIASSPLESGERWSIEPVTWGTDGTSLWARDGDANLIITLDGDVHVFPYQRGFASFFSPDLRYHIALEGSLSLEATSLTVTEIATGQVVVTLTPEEGDRLMHGAGPVSGKYVFTSFPRGAQRGDAAHRLRVTVGHVIDLETGERTLLSDDKELPGDALWIWARQGRVAIGGYWGLGGSFLDQCYYHHQDVEPCLRLADAAQEALYDLYGEPTNIEERRERASFLRRTGTLGFIWLD